MNLLTIADGFGDSHAVPAWYPRYLKWPELIKLMTKGINLLNCSRYGAGNEYMVQCLKNNFQNKDLVLIQWAQPDRLDLTLCHDEVYTKFWEEQIASDPVYHNNTIELNQQKIWLSSASKLDSVTEYHKKFIGLTQHQTRSQIYIDYATLLLQSVPYGFLLTSNSDYLKNFVSKQANWCWHEPFCGMSEFRHHSKFAELDLGLVQPIPLIHFDFIRQFIQPRFDLPWRSERELQAVESMLYRNYTESITNRPI
jgi:hypothetical protein